MAQTEAEKQAKLEVQNFMDSLKKNGKKTLNDETNELEFSFDIEEYFNENEVTRQRKSQLCGMVDPKSPTDLRPVHYAAIFDDLKTLDYLMNLQCDMTEKNQLSIQHILELFKKQVSFVENILLGLYNFLK